MELGALPQGAAHFLEAAVQAGANLVVSGPTGSGKTTFLNALGAAIASPEERVITVEEVAELQLDRQLPDCVALQARGGNVEGVGEIRIRDLVRNALRMRPTRIVVGEVRGAEALDMLLAMMAEERLSGEALVKMLARTIDLVLQLRFEPRTGRRRLVSVFEVTGLEGSVVTGNELWALDPKSDRLAWTGIRPRLLEKMAARGVPYSLPTAAEAVRQ